MMRNRKLNESRMRELALLPSSIKSAACSACLPVRNSYKCPNSLLCRDCVGGSVSIIEGVVKSLRETIWKESGSASQRRRCLVDKLRENMTIQEDESLTIIFYLNGVKVCKSYFRVIKY